MKSQSPIKDKDKLFRKLFISPSFFQQIEPPLLVSPDFIAFLLQQSTNSSRQQKIQLVNEIINIFVQRPTNSLLLNFADRVTRKEIQKSILDSIIMRILDIVQTEQEVYLPKIELMLAYYRIGLRNISKITQWLSKQIHLQKKDPIKLMFVLRILRLYFSEKLGANNVPSSYFYLLGTQNCGIQLAQHPNSEEIVIKNELSISLIFNHQGQINNDDANTNKFNLFYLKTDKKEEICINFQKGVIKISSFHNGKFLDQIAPFQNLSQQVWYRLLINFTNSTTECYLDQHKIQSRALLRKQKERKIKQCIYGKQFFGLLGSLTVSGKIWPIQKFQHKQYKFGLSSWQQLISFNKSGLVNSVFVSCLPFSTFSVRRYQHCFDIFRRNHSSISENIYICDQPIMVEGIQNYGGSKILLPLFYFARFYSLDGYPDLLEDLLKILLQILIADETTELDDNFHAQNFFHILGQHMQDIPHFHTYKTIKLLHQIYKRLYSNEVKLSFIRHVLWNINLPVFRSKRMSSIDEQGTKLQQQLISQYYGMMIKIYENQRSLAEQAYNFEQIAYWMVHNLQNPCGIMFSCCLQHYVNESILSNGLQMDEVTQLGHRTIKQHYTYMQMILANMLEMVIINSKNGYALAVEKIKVLLRLLLQKYSPCLYLTVLTVIKRQIYKFKSGQEIVTILSDQSLELLSFLVFVSEKTINPDIISQVVYLALFMAEKHHRIERRSDYIDLVVHLLTINQDIVAINHVSPLVAGVKKIRKLSMNLGDAKYNQGGNLQLQKKGGSQQLQKKGGSQQLQKKGGSSQSYIKGGRRRRSQSFQLQVTKYRQAKKNHQNIVMNGQIVQSVKKCPKHQLLSNWPQLYNLIINYLSGWVSDSQPKQDVIITCQKSINILKQYYNIACPVFKQKILLYLLCITEKHPSVRQLKTLNLFLLQNLTPKPSSLQKQYQQTTLIAIYSCIFSHIITNNQDICIYYASIKCIKAAKMAISIMLPKVIPKVIKLMRVDQLCQMLSICRYENIETTKRRETIELMYCVIWQLHQTIKKQLSECLLVDKSIQFMKVPHLVIKQQNAQIFKKIKQITIFTEMQRQNESNEGQSPTKKPIKFSKILKKIIRQFNQQKKMNGIQEILHQNAIMIQDEVVSNTDGDSRVSESQLNIIEFAENQRKSDIKQINKAKNISQQQTQQSAQKKQNKYENTVYYNKNIHKFQLSLFQVYLTACHDILTYSQFPKQSQIHQNLQNLCNDHLALVMIYAISVSSQGLSEDQRQTSLHNIFIYLYKCYMRKDMEKIQLFLNFVFLQLTAMQKIALSPLLLKNKKSSTSTQKQNKFTNIFEQLGEEYLKIIEINTLTNLQSEQRRQSIITKVDEFMKSKYLTGLLQKLTSVFMTLQDQNDLLIVEKYQHKIEEYVKNYEEIIYHTKTDAKFRNIQKLFDQENAIQEKVRVKYLYKAECEFRKCHADWDRIWTNLRIYHQPYGFWMAQRSKEGEFCYPSHKIRNFKYQISQYVSQSGICPILQAKILEPWQAIKDNKAKQNKYINSFAQMMRPSQIKKSKDSEQGNILNNIWKNMVGIPKKSNEKIRQYDVVWVCRSNKSIGKLFIQNKQDLIFYYESIRQDDSHISFQKFSLPYNRQTFQKWDIFQIKDIKIHRYLLKYHALQLKMSEGKSLIFNFINQDKQDFLKELEKIQKQKLAIFSTKLYKLNKIQFFSEKIFDFTHLIDPKITQMWRKREISNLQYLICVNGAGSRGIFDLSQYYVFPWIAELRNQKEPKLRDLSKTMGALGSSDRINIYKEKFYSHDPFNPHPPFFFGTHYSSPGVVFNYLIRLSPFTEYCKHLQGGKFDIADRLFCSLVSAWKSATEQVSDVRQMIPQFYYLPEVLINIDEYNFGLTQSFQKINHVHIPNWSAHNPYFFISQMRIMLQSEEISKSLNQWIDLIFGYKQKGKQAEENLNVYYYLTYEQHANLEQEQEQVYIKSKESQIAHFGQIPPLIFPKPHAKRNPALLGMPQLQFSKKIKLFNSLKEKPIGLKIIKNDLTIVKRQQIEIYSILSSPASLQKKKRANIQKSYSQLYYILKKQKSKVSFLGKNYILIWGYLNNQFRIINKNTGNIQQSDQLQSKITSLYINKDQNLILVGLFSGLLVFYQIQYGTAEIFLKRIGHESFPSEITHIDQYDGFYSIVFGNYVGIYKIGRTLHYLSSQKQEIERVTTNSIKFFRSFYNHLPIKAAFIVSSPLFSLIIVDNAHIKTYSINGQYIRGIFSNASNLKVYGRFKDHQLHDVFYAAQEDRIVCYSIPDLRSVSILQLPEEYEFIGEQYLTIGANRNEIWKFEYVGVKQQ